MSMYLCYDLKGIQQYIFQVPKLKSCIGGSRQIDDFDRLDAGGLQVPGCAMIYTGGGKGAFECADEPSMQGAKSALVELARRKGLTIRFGFDDDYTRAAREIRETYVYQPDELDGHPCQLSGLYPTNSGVHPLMKQRLEKGGEHGMEGHAEKEFLEAIRRECGRPELHFFYDVDSAGSREGRDAAEALGNRNRWAVVCMDGNDMGSQFLSFLSRNPSESEWKSWLPKMSRCLDECTREAAKSAMVSVAKSHLEANGGDTLPLRPLIVGGDDVTVLVGCDYALEFVETVMEEFEKASRRHSELWVGTGGVLTISGGILYAPVSLPLHSALEYAEELLASAKSHGRELNKDKGRSASPACLDWESVTEGMLDSAGDRRRRELMFVDDETGNKVELTARPYSLDELNAVKALRDELTTVPRSIQHEIHPALYSGLARRLAFYAKIGKNHPLLESLLREPVPGVGGVYGEGWSVSGAGGIQRTSVLDALLLLQEEHRMKNPTI
ncbi:MAG: hypothetical protein IJS15_11135 [Victivallales bacterium]|nr:hypothetical protein [Victivallales bacterium]